MKLRLLAIILFLFVASVGSIVVLYFLSDYVVHRQGNFYRTFPPHPAVLEKGVKFDLQHAYIAGATSETLYVGNSIRPLEVIKFELPTLDTSALVLDLSIKDSIRSYGSMISVDSPFFYFHDGAIPFIFKGLICCSKMTPMSFDSVPFLEFKVLGNSSFVFRTYNKARALSAIGKFDPHSKSTFNFDLLQKQIDGFFCTDGMLHINDASNQVVYIYYYRNEYFVADSLLNLLYRANTIDTTTVAKIEFQSIPRQGYESKRLAGPPPVINRCSGLFGDFLLINSTAKAQNESQNSFAKAAVIDVYNTRAKQYQFSFYLYDEYGERMRSFFIHKDRLFVLYPRYLACYNFNENIFSRYRDDG